MESIKEIRREPFTAGLTPQSFLRQLKQPRLIETALVKRDEPTLSGLCEKEGIEETRLPELLREKVGQIGSMIRRGSGFIDETENQIDFLYQVWHATRDLSEDHPLFDFAKTLDSFEAFTATYLGDQRSDVQSNFAQRIDRFRNFVVHPERVLTVYSPECNLANASIYDYGGEWLPVPRNWSYWTGNTEDYIETSVVEEIVGLTEEGLPKQGLYHASGSAALPGIAKHGAILSSEEVRGKGEEVKTGEYFTDVYISHGGKERRGICTSVYAARSLMDGYFLSRWFDEFPVGFSISPERQEEYLEKGSDEMGVDHFIHRGSEGILIGARIPLASVNAVYTEMSHLDEVREWTRENVPHAQVVPLEVYRLMARDTFSSPAKRKKFLGELLAQKPIVLGK